MLEMSTVAENNSEPARTRTLSMVSVAMTTSPVRSGRTEAEALVGVHNPIQRELNSGSPKS